MHPYMTLEIRCTGNVRGILPGRHRRRCCGCCHGNASKTLGNAGEGRTWCRSLCRSLWWTDRYRVRSSPIPLLFCSTLLPFQPFNSQTQTYHRAGNYGYNKYSKQWGREREYCSPPRRPRPSPHPTCVFKRCRYRSKRA